MVSVMGTGTVFAGLSTDTKPLDVGNSSIFIEMDTSTIYIYDSVNRTWYEM